MVMADGFLRFRQQTSKDAPYGAFFISTHQSPAIDKSLGNAGALRLC
jgi:hypothetical protein